uniref:DUF223 domain-containing protein n=1 Tax=Brassica oleracea TaxID=3712 RepID=A0A3P6EZG2_BRAOL|nr:unnamed protein product [Brassica oleracea]
MILIFDEPNLHLLENVSLCLSSFSNRRPAVRHSTFESLRLGRSSQSIAFGFLRFWDSLNFKKDKEFVGITVLFLDENVNSVIYGFTPVRRANHYMPSLKEGSIVKVDHFEVARCSSMYTITDHPFLISFISLTIIGEVITSAPEINLQSRLEYSTIANIFGSSKQDYNQTNLKLISPFQAEQQMEANFSGRFSTSRQIRRYILVGG